MVRAALFRSFQLWLSSVLLIAFSGACESSSETKREAVAPPVLASSKPRPEPEPSESWPRDPRDVTVHHPRELDGLELDKIERLNLALSDADRVGHITDGEGDPCLGIDPHRLAPALTKLHTLRISGCPAVVQSGLAAFAGRVKDLELADLTLDGVMVGRIGQLAQLEALTLRRARLGTENLKPLRNLGLRELTLVELGRDSALSLMVDMWPKTLEHLELSGEWAGHKAMLTVAKAKGLRHLELRDTRVGNFSLNQIKPLSRLETIVLSGTTFNDNSPLYFRELGIKSFTCDCPRISDGGMRALRHSIGIEHLELLGTTVSGEALASLAELQGLKSLRMSQVDLGPEGFEALSEFSKLTDLDLSGQLVSIKMEHLGDLVHLRRLRLAYRNFGDPAAPELAKLQQLRELDISGTQVSDVGLAALAGLTHLERLRLDHTRVTNRGLTHISMLTRLRVLELDHTDVVDAGVAHLGGLRELEELRLDSTLVTDKGLKHLLGLVGLVRLNLANTVVSTAGVAQLSALPNLQVLGLRGTRAQP